jgi:antitoxin VapB
VYYYFNSTQDYPMALNIKNREVERLAAEVAELAGETKTEAIRRALADRRARLRTFAPPEAARRRRLERFLRLEVWSRIPADQLGRPPTKAEREEILGYGAGGV